MKCFIALFTTAAFGFFPAASLGQNLLTNGSFETGIGSGGTLSAGSNQLTGWTISGDRSLYWVTPGGANPLVPPDGTNYVDLNGAGGRITLSQSFPTTPGKLYEVRFSVGYFQATNCCSPYVLTATVESSNGMTLASDSARLGQSHSIPFRGHHDLFHTASHGHERHREL
jgi:hypothetical protein